MIKKLLIANRGEIACRIIKSARKMGIATVAVYSDADINALHVKLADEAVHVGPAPANQSYIVIKNILSAIAESGADAVHPGYGFLSENPAFVQALEKEKITFVGPSAAAITAMGDKITAKKLAQDAGVSTVPGHMGLIADAKEAVKVAKKIGYPVMIKATAGGGGKGMRIARNDAEVHDGFHLSQSEASASFGDDRIFIEKLIEQPRHIEIQILADQQGNCIHLNERECSIQRRNQKIIEEAPSPFLDQRTRDAMGAQAVRLARAVDYDSAGTVEFIVDRQGGFYFLEMNTRLQVEHPVTEMTTGLDLVEQMIRVANGEKLGLTQSDIKINGWAIECRLYAEDPFRNFLPSTGRLSLYRPPMEEDSASGAIRNDTGVYEGGEISVYYDPMIAKLCSWAPSRALAIAKMHQALDTFLIKGIGHNLPFLSAVIDHKRFQDGALTTGFIEEEFPGGFSGVTLEQKTLRRLAAFGAHVKRINEVRAGRISGVMADHMADAAWNGAANWVVFLGDTRFALEVVADETGTDVSFADGVQMHVKTDWRFGQVLAHVHVDGVDMVVKVDAVRGGIRLRYRGAEFHTVVRRPRQAELFAFMLKKKTPDMSNLLLCPMPGLVVSIDVSPGDKVQAGQALCTIEAMKMENILRAERESTIQKINTANGDSLAVDAVIMEFE